MTTCSLNHLSTVNSNLPVQVHKTNKYHSLSSIKKKNTTNLRVPQA